MRISSALSARLLPVLILAHLPAFAGDKSNLDVARQLNQAFVEVTEKVIPTVVVITVTQKAPTYSDTDNNSGDSQNNRRRNQRRFRDPEEYIGQGSGVIIRKDGYLVTNRHVVEDAESIEVRLKDGKKFKAAIRGVDAQSDVAVLKIEAENLPVAKLADTAKTRVGEFAIAIGAPFQFDYSVTFGHVSAKSRDNVMPRYFGGSTFDQDFIQTDANINPGNSGGPLVNIEGEVIGINTVISGFNTGIGFAIPSSLVKLVSDQIIEEGHFTRARLGVSIVALAEDDRYREMIQGVSEGVVVRAIEPDSPAAKSELRASDVILAVDGKRVTTPQELRNEVRAKKIGSVVKLTVFRSGKQLPVEIRPTEWVGENETKPVLVSNNASPRTNTPAKLGIEVKSLTIELAEKFSVKHPDSGVIVVSVEKESLADQNGIKPGDIITAVNDSATPNPRRYREALQSADWKKGVILHLTSGGTARFEILKEGE